MGLFSSSASSKTSNSADQSYRPNQQKDIGAAQIQIGSAKKIGLNVSDSRDFSDRRSFSDSRSFADSSKVDSDNSFSDSRSFADNSTTTTNITTTDHGAIQGAFNNNYYVVDRALSAFEKTVAGSTSNMKAAYQGFNNSTEKVHEQLLGNVENTEDSILGMGDKLVQLFVALVVGVIGVVAITRGKKA
ncbi:MAG: hypothetical protein COB04_18400 [Gammaproteobacteria bacterium]|nr:MAG: hypothetical protein COB04_18400 [Gammaproteobacteria bacterium]